jgi:hypothetical protein
MDQATISIIILSVAAFIGVLIGVIMAFIKINKQK